MGKVRLGGQILLKLLEQSPKILCLIVRKECEDPVRRLLLPRMLGLLSLLIVGVRIPGIDLHDIVDQAHDHRVQHVDLLVGILREKIAHDRHVPGVLRIVLPPSVACQVCLPENVLFLVQFQYEIHLRLKALSCHIVHVFQYTP